MDHSNFASNDSRITNRKELDTLISSKTRKWDNIELMDVLQQAGISAGAVLNGKELLFNKHMAERNFFEIVAHQPGSQIPKLPYPGKPWKMSKHSQVNMVGAPSFGQHNEIILKHYLGISDESYQQLRNEAAISEKIDIVAKEIRVSREEKAKEGSIHSYDPNFKSAVKSYFDI